MFVCMVTLATACMRDTLPCKLTLSILQFYEFDLLLAKLFVSSSFFVLKLSNSVLPFCELSWGGFQAESV